MTHWWDLWPHQFKKVKLEKDELIAKLDEANNGGVSFLLTKRKVQGKRTLFHCQWKSKPESQRESLFSKIKGKEVMSVVGLDKK